MVFFIPLAGIGAGIVGATVLTPLLAAPVLNLVGFTAAGPAAGMVAAGIQASIGNVAAGSLFATAQGIAMRAGVPVLAKVVGGAVSEVVGSAVTAIFKPLLRQSDSPPPPDDTT